MDKKEQLKEKVVNLVREFVKSEGGITQADLQVLFGDTSDPRKAKECMMFGVGAALRNMPISFN